MNQELKNLLFKDLCARLPYGVKISVQSWDEEEQEYVDKVDVLYSINRDEYIKSTNEDYDFSIEDIKPYLFPLSSMTEEEKNKLGDELIELQLKAISDEIDSSTSSAYEIDYYNSHHIDYRDLIKKGLAIDCTNLNIY